MPMIGLAETAPHCPHRQLVLAAALVTASIAAATSAGAQEYCVSCTGPAAVYRCVLDVKKPPGMPLKMLCITRLAKDGGHDACAIRGGTVFDCVGPKRVVTLEPASSAAGAANPTGKPAAPPSRPAAGPRPNQAAAVPKPVEQPTPAATPPSKTKKPGETKPATVEDLARQAGQASTKTLKQAGDSISSSTSKAWKCVTSLFKSC